MIHAVLDVIGVALGVLAALVVGAVLVELTVDALADFFFRRGSGR